MREPIHHKLKTDYFMEVLTGHKRFEIRLNDRDYQPKDTFSLIDNVGGGEWGPTKIKYVLKDAEKHGLLPGYCIFCW